MDDYASMERGTSPCLLGALTCHGLRTLEWFAECGLVGFLHAGVPSVTSLTVAYAHCSGVELESLLADLGKGRLRDFVLVSTPISQQVVCSECSRLLPQKRLFSSLYNERSAFKVQTNVHQFLASRPILIGTGTGSVGIQPAAGKFGVAAHGCPRPDTRDRSAFIAGLRRPCSAHAAATG